MGALGPVQPTPFGLSLGPFGPSPTPFGLSPTPLGVSRNPFGLSLSKPFRVPLKRQGKCNGDDRSTKRSLTLTPEFVEGAGRAKGKSDSTLRGLTRCPSKSFK